MQLAHAIGSLTKAQAHHGHVENSGISTNVILGSEFENASHWQISRRVITPEVALNQIGWESINSSRDRSMRREYRPGANHLKCLIEIQIRRFNEFAHSLNTQEAGMAFIGVEHLGRRRSGDAAEGTKCTNSTNTQKEFLLESVLTTATIKAIGDVTFGRLVEFDVGIEHKQRHSTYIGDPDVRT
jgi:hypothetical protein